ncbi:bifunctional 5,10-methylenetetrahydrofolate dehydrogenase/5,10-methenyltetrahydrofolate cyclohydrolase [Rossellomorea marisflavi]|uniref:bifunctional 5,10-methylenetetrahydrofolate dehydrogenase/5,10-methenyltetrahydrofolate cyclohydrolase n=1 Tax=Rossellomorea marisflavi TaxID=189381 RepID=UPI003513C933
MSTRIIDGTKISYEWRLELKSRVRKLKQRGITPGLAIILVGDNPASRSFVRLKEKACSDVGIHSELHHFESADQDQLVGLIDQLNTAGHIHGILVQLPLPGHIDPASVVGAVSPTKDIDGLHPLSIGRLATAQETFHPCAPLAITKMLQHEKIPIAGRHVVIIGKSNLIGKPLGTMLVNRDATVTQCQSITEDLFSLTRQADILISAAGKAGFIGREAIKPGALVIDAGMNRGEDGGVCGDVDADDVMGRAGLLTPVPGGIGPLTITMLLYNTVKSATGMF